MLAVVEAAHIISGYDNAQRLKKIEGAAGALLHAHESELKSRLEAIYRHCKELIRGNLNQLSAQDQHKLHRQCQSLMELRGRWRADFEHRLRGIKKVQPGVIYRILWWRKEQGIRKDRPAKAREANRELEVVHLMHFSLMLQMTLAGASGRMESFRAHTLLDECAKWRELMEFTSERASDICSYKYTEPEEFKPLLDAIFDLAEFWSPDRWAEERSRVALESEGRTRKSQNTERSRSAGGQINTGRSLNLQWIIIMTAAHERGQSANGGGRPDPAWPARVRPQ